MAADPVKNNGTTLPDTDKAAVLGGLDKIIKDRDLYREERDRSLDLNHKFEEIVQRQDQELAGLRGREGQNENEVRRILIKDYKYNPEKLNGKDPVQELYKLQEGAAASYTLTSDLCRRTGKQSIEELREYLVHKVSSAGRKPDRQSSRNWKYVLPSIGLVALAAIGGYSFVKGRQQSSVQPPPTEQKYDQKQKSASGPNVATLVVEQLKIQHFTCDRHQSGNNYVQCEAQLNKRDIKASCDWVNTSVNPKKSGQVGLLEKLDNFRVLVDPTGGRQRIELTCPDPTRSVTMYVDVDVREMSVVRELGGSATVEKSPTRAEAAPKATVDKNKDRERGKKTDSVLPSYAGIPAAPVVPQPAPLAPVPTTAASESSGTQSEPKAQAQPSFKSLQLYDLKPCYKSGETTVFNFAAAEGTTPQFSRCGPSVVEELSLEYNLTNRNVTMTIPKNVSGDYSLLIDCKSSEGDFKSMKKNIRITPSGTCDHQMIKSP